MARITVASLPCAEIAPRGKPKPPFFCLGNELCDVFLPIIGAECFAVYAYFVRREFTDPKLKHSIREVAAATKLSPATVSRSLEILEHLALLQLTRFRGSKESECKLRDSREVALSLGAEYHKKTLSFALPPDVAQRLTSELKALHEKQQGKAARRAPGGCGNPIRDVSQRNASVSLVTHQRSASETQDAPYLLIIERTIKEDLSPTPFLTWKTEKAKGLPGDGNAPQQEDLTWARAKFDGVMKDIRSHLDTSRPVNANLTNGYTDWQQFSLGSLAVARTSWSGEMLCLVLSASDPAAAQRGLGKYSRKWEESVRKWYGCEVQVELIQAEHGR